VKLDFDITIIGNGSASPHKTRYPAAQYLSTEGHHWLVDCGEGTQFRLMRMGLKRSKLEGIVITHMHGDHYLGLFGLLSSMSMDQRSKPLYIVGPSSLESLVKAHINQGGYQMSYAIEFIHTDGVKEKVTLLEQGGLKLESFPLQHRIPCWGYRFTYHKQTYHLKLDKIKLLGIPQSAWSQIGKGMDYADDTMNYMNAELTDKEEQWKSYAYCSDTAYFDELVNYIRGVDLLYHEATFLEAKSIRASETFHATANQAATIALKGQVRDLLIGHFSSRYDELDEFLIEAKQVFESTQIAEQGQVFSIQ
jgi:ribonuclease Z